MKVTNIVGIELEDLGFSMRVYNALRRLDINTLNDLLEKSFNDIRNIKNIGKHSIREIINKLNEYGYEYTDNPDEFPVKIIDKTISYNNVLLKNLGLEKKDYLCLNRGGVFTIGEFNSKSDKELLKIRSFGKIKLHRVKRVIQNYIETKEADILTDVGVDQELSNKCHMKLIKEYDEKIANYERKIGEYEARVLFLEDASNIAEKKNRYLEETLEKANKDINYLNGMIENFKKQAVKADGDILITINKATNLMKQAGIGSLSTTINGYAVDIQQKYIVKNGVVGA